MELLKVYGSCDDPSELIEILKQLDVFLENFFEKLQIIKEYHGSPIVFRELYKAGEAFGFDDVGALKMNFDGSSIKITYSYFDHKQIEYEDFMLV